MKICIFAINLSRSGGTEKMAVSLANELAIKGHFIQLISLESFEKPFFKPLPQIALQSLNLQSSKLKLQYFKAVNRLRKILKEKEIDVIIDVDVLLSLITIRTVRDLKTKVIAWEHYNFFAKTESKARVWARKLAARKATAVVTLTEEDVGFYKAHCKCHSKIIAIPNFITSLSEKTANSEQKILLSIGHLNYGKGFDMLLKAWSLVKKADSDGWKLHIVGEGEEKENLINLCKHLQLENDLLIFPPTTEIEKHFLSASVFVMSSRREGLPMVLIEAKSYGLPIVSFSCQTGPSEIVRDNIDGFLVAPNNIIELKDKLITIMRNNILRQEMAINARKDSSRFLAKAIIDKWEKLLANTEQEFYMFDS